MESRLQNLERAKATEGRPDITANVTPPTEHKRERDSNGLPTLTADEAADVRAGNTLCFLFDTEPRQVSFKPDGSGGIAVST